MTFATKLRLMTAIFGVAAGTAALGVAVYGEIPSRPSPTAARPIADPLQAAAETARTKFSALPTVTYRTTSGETAFAWQLKPKVPTTAARFGPALSLEDSVVAIAPDA